MTKDKKTFGSPVVLGIEPESQIVASDIPVTKPKLTCIFVSDGVYRYEEAE